MTVTKGPDAASSENTMFFHGNDSTSSMGTMVLLVGSTSTESDLLSGGQLCILLISLTEDSFNHLLKEIVESVVDMELGLGLK